MESPGAITESPLRYIESKSLTSGYSSQCICFDSRDFVQGRHTLSRFITSNTNRIVKIRELNKAEKKNNEFWGSDCWITGRIGGAIRAPSPPQVWDSAYTKLCDRVPFKCLTKLGMFDNKTSNIPPCNNNNNNNNNNNEGRTAQMCPHNPHS